MGLDMSAVVIKADGYRFNDKEYIGGARNSSMFLDIQHEEGVYENLPVFKKYFDENIIKDKEFLKQYNDDWTFGHTMIKIDDLYKFCEKYHPERDAFWMTTYDKWLYENHRINPSEYDFSHYLEESDVIEDMHFVEVEKWWEVFSYLVKQFKKDKVPKNAYLCYCFDH